MKNQHNSKTETLKSVHRRGLILNLIGAVMIISAVLGCSISEFKFGEKKRTGGNNSSKSDTEPKSNDKNLPLKEKIVGNWEGKVEGRTMSMTFTADGRMKMSAEGRSEPARYKVIDEETIATADGGDENYNERMKVNIIGDKITLSQLGGKVFGEFTRIGDSRDKSESSEKTNDSRSSDEELLLKLTETSARFIRADYIGDKKTLESVIADEAEILDANGSKFNKQEYIDSASLDPLYISNTVKEARIQRNTGSTAELKFIIIVEFTDRTTTTPCTGYYIKNNTWQMKSFECEETSIVKKTSNVNKSK
jgi:hypothetical protein